MNMQPRLIRELMLLQFEIDHNAAKATEKFVVQKMEVPLIPVQQPDGARNFAYVVRALMIKQEEVGLKGKFGE